MSGSLGSLYISLEAKLGNFVAGMNKAEHVSKTQMQKIQRNADAMARSLRKSFGKFGDVVAAAFAVREITNFTRSLAETQIAAQRIQYTMQQAFGANAGAQIRFVTDLAQKLGLNLQTSEQAFAELGASAQGTKVTASDLQTLFKGMAESATVLHTSDADVAGVYTQLAQGISLGKLHMQDIRAIAQHLPGTMVILTKAAKDMGTTLSSALAHGGLDAATALKYIGIELQKTFGAQAVAASHSLNAELNRLHTTLFSVQAGAKGLEESFAGAVRAINNALQDPQTMQALQGLIVDFGKGIAGLAEAAAKAAPYLKDLANNIGAIAVFFGTRLVAVKILGFFASISTGARLATTAMTVMRGVLAALGGPIGIAALAIGGLAVGFRYLYNAATTYKDLHPALDAAMKHSASDVTTMSGLIDRLATSYGDAAVQLGTLIQEQLTKSGIDWANQATQVRALADELSAAKDKLSELQKQHSSYQQNYRIAGPGVNDGILAAQTINSLALQKQQDKVKKLTADLNKAQQQQLADQNNYYAGQHALAQARKQSTMKAPPSPTTVDPKAVAKATSAYQALVDAVNKLSDSNDTLLDKEEAQIRALASTGGKAIAAGADQTKVQAEVAAGIDKIIAKYQQQIRIQQLQEQQYQRGLQNQVDIQQKQYQFQLQSVNMTQDQIDAQTRLNDVTSKYQDQLLQLQNQLALATNPQDKATIQQHISDTQHAMNQAVANTKDYNNKLQAQKESPIAGMKEGMLEFAQTGLDVADQMKSAFNSLFSGLSDAIVQWAETGKLNFKDVLKSFLEMVLKMEIQAMAAKVILGFLGVGVFGTDIAANYMSGGGATYAASGVNWNVGLLGQAKGGAWFNGIQKFARGSVFANKVVSSPTLFKFAGGTGVMGEAGPEAIMPLTRGKDGKLGVQVSGNSQASGNNTQPVTVNVINNTSSQAQVQESTGQDGSKLINVIIGEVNNQIARGGSTYKTISQTFGLRRQGVPV